MEQELMSSYKWAVFDVGASWVMTSSMFEYPIKRTLRYKMAA